MKTERILISPISEVRGESPDFNLRETFLKYLYHWPLFLVGVLLALILAFLYVRYSVPVYEVKAKLLIKDEKQGGDQSADDIRRMDLFKSSRIVENEIEVLRSKTLMQKVVNKLQLWTSYEKVGQVHNLDYYDRKPFRFSLINASAGIPEGSFEVIVKDNENFTLIDKEGEERTCKFGAAVSNGMGTWRLDTTANLQNCIGEKIRLSFRDPEEAAESYTSKITTEKVNKEASVITVAIEDKVLNRGKDVMSSLIDAYNEAAANEKRQLAEKALQFIDERLSSLSGELTGVEKDFEGFRSSRGITDVSSEANLYLENVKSNDIQLNDVNVKLNIITDIERFVNSGKANAAPATLGLSDPGLISNINRLMELQLQKDKLLATTPEGNPMFEPINNQISTARAAIRDNIQSMKSSLLSAKRQLNSNNSRFESSIKDIPGQERKYVSIKRQQSVKENLFIYLLQKKEEASLSYAQTLTSSRVVDYSYEKNEKKKLSFAVAFFLGLIVPAGLVYGRGLINNRVTSSHELEETAVPLLGEIAYADTQDVVVVKDTERSLISEQFRALRTNLLYLHGDRERGRVTLLTSSIPSEGKSFVSLNVGTALASSGRKTVILELDFRKPKIAEYLNIGEGKGLSEYLSGDAGRDEIISPLPNEPDLYIMKTGALPLNPTKLLDQKRMDELIAWLRTEFDDIIIDTPPVYLVIDAMILARLADVTLYIVRQDVTLKEHLNYIKQIGKQAKFKKLNLIFNAVRMDGKYGYGYSQNYGYYTSASASGKGYNGALKKLINRL